MNLRARLSLDPLEDRWTPDATVDASAGVVGAAAVVIIQQASSINPPLSPPITIITSSPGPFIPPYSTTP